VKRLALSFVLLAALSLWTAQPVCAATVGIVPPPGWLAKSMNAPSPSMQMIGVWASPVVKDGVAENINLLSEDTASTFEDYTAVQRANVQKILSKEFAQDADEDCGAAKAHRFEYRFVFGDRMLDITQLIRVVDGKAYIATYTRLPDSDADPAALVSLRSLCAPPVS